MVERACLLIRLGGVDGHNTPPNPQEGDFLFSPLFLGLLSLQGTPQKTSKKATDREQTETPFPPITIFTPRAPPPTY